MPITANNSLRVDSNATMRQLEELMNRDAGAKVYGRKDDQGVITLYTSNKKSSTNLIDRMTGHAAKRRQAGREGLDQIFTGVLRPVSKDYDFKNIYKDIKKGINPEDPWINQQETNPAKIKKMAKKFAKVIEIKTHAVKVDTVKKYLNLALPVADRMPTAAPASKPLLRGLSLAATGMTNKLDLLRDAADEIEAADIDGLRSLAKDFGDMIEASYSQRNRSAKDPEALALSDGARMKQELRSALSLILGGIESKPDLKFKVEFFVDNAVNRASSKAAASEGSSLGRVINDDNRSFGSKQVSPIVIEGKTYIPEKHLTQGGYGDVFLMKNDEGQRLVYKLPIQDQQEETSNQHELTRRMNSRQENLSAGADEITAHKAATAKPHPNVLGLRGAVRTEDGRLGIVLDYMPNHSLEALAEKISTASENGTISQGAANAIRMTLIKEMAQGLKHLHNNGITHYDFKPQNCMIDADGHVKIGDFGESFVGDKGDVFNLKQIKKPIYKAPDILLAEAKGENDFESIGKQAVAGDVSALKTHFGEALPKPKPKVGEDPESAQIQKKKHDELVDRLAENVMKPASKRHEEAAKAMRPNAYEVSNKVDVWGFGIAAHQVITGIDWSVPFENFDANIEEALKAFADPANGSKPAVSTTSTTMGAKGLSDGSLLLATSSEEGNALLNDLLVPSASARPDMDRVIGHAAFSAPGVGAPEVNDLLKALLLKDDDPTRSAAIRAANDTLTDVVIASYAPLGTVIQG